MQSFYVSMEGNIKFYNEFVGLQEFLLKVGLLIFEKFFREFLKSKDRWEILKSSDFPL